MLVIFLDFDGVINPGFGRWKKALVARLNSITDQTGAKIVVHSSWRWSRTLEQIRHILTKHHDGLPVTGEILDLCPSANFYQTRAGIYVTDGDFDAFRGNIETRHERAIAIQRWLNEHPGEIKRYVILDDSPHLGHFVGTPEFIQTDTHIGLTADHVKRAVLHLKGVTW